MAYKKGDRVWIKKEKADYNGKYSGTEGTVVNILSYGVVIVKTYDGNQPMFPEDCIMLYDNYIKGLPKGNNECECGLKAKKVPSHAHYRYCPLHRDK